MMVRSKKTAVLLHSYWKVIGAHGNDIESLTE
jgi:hypothetical protein